MKANALITKYALSSGVTVVIGGELSHTDTKRPSLVDATTTWHSYYHGDDFQLTKEEARAQVEKMAVKRRKSLEKSLAALDKLKAKALKQIEEADLNPIPADSQGSTTD